MDRLKLQTTFAPEFRNIDKVRNEVRKICSESFTAAGSTEVNDDFCLVVSELMNNAVEHGHCGMITAELKIRGNQAIFRLMTDGIPFDPTKAAAMPAMNDIKELPDGGFGLAIIQKLSDSINYEYRDGRNIIILRKDFPNFVEGRNKMELRVEMDGNVIFLKMNGSLASSTADMVKTQVQKLVEKKYKHLVFDMSKVDFIDSSGLGFCISSSRELDALAGKLVCFGLKENVRKLFAMTRADQKIKVFETRSEAFDFMLEEMGGVPA